MRQPAPTTCCFPGSGSECSAEWETCAQQEPGKAEWYGARPAAAGQHDHGGRSCAVARIREFMGFHRARQTLIEREFPATLACRKYPSSRIIQVRWCPPSEIRAQIEEPGQRQKGQCRQACPPFHRALAHRSRRWNGSAPGAVGVSEIGSAKSMRTHLGLAARFPLEIARRPRCRSRRSFLTGRYAKQTHDLRDMVANGEVRQVKSATNLLVRQACCQQGEDFSLSARQIARLAEGAASRIDLRHRCGSLDESDFQSNSAGQRGPNSWQCRLDGVHKSSAAGFDDQPHACLVARYNRLRGRCGLGHEALRQSLVTSARRTLDVSQGPIES